jgi:hypothetical protein
MATLPDAAAFPDLIAKYGKKGEPAPRPTPEQLEKHRAYRAQFAHERVTEVEIAGRRYRIESPSPNFFFDRLRNDRPFAFARLPHGFWDALVMRDQIAAEPQLASVPLAERRLLACRIGRLAKPFHGGFVEGFDAEMAALIPEHRNNPDFFKSVAFKGFPTPDEDLFDPGTSPQDRAERLALLAQTFAPYERLFDAIVWKRYAYSGDLERLAALCHDRHVVLLARDYFGDLKMRWKLSRFTHITIERQLSQLIRHVLFDKLQSALSGIVKEPGARPVVLMQCGGSLAYWLIAKLFAWNPAVFYVDLGQALNIWFMDLKDTHGQAWTRFYEPAPRK